MPRGHTMVHFPQSMHDERRLPAFSLSPLRTERIACLTLVPEKTPDGKVLLYATMPEFENADGTKAAISSSGVFSWTPGDKIDVVYTNGVGEEKTYTFECSNASTGAFTYDGDDFEVFMKVGQQGYYSDPRRVELETVNNYLEEIRLTPAHQLRIP